ncbi:hypothetical protein L3X38_033537 [Prunus dulcis]|uniref:Uncharacterized protein n=1 Tax=Prunus dulcis TaxID=3755 RepID=A0AAD4VG33_PRUDU|nr:hypothetical protein L3X38_033537 [Prunus dulcis]
MRLYMDSRWLNKITVRNRCSLPRSEELCAQIVPKGDLRPGYLQLRVGFVLIQHGRVSAYASRQLKKPELKYPIQELERPQ